MLYFKKKGSIYLSHRCKPTNDKNIDSTDLRPLKNKYNYLRLVFDLIFSKVIILDDSLVSLGYFNFSSKQKIIQVWHACGAFKKFGIDSVHNQNKKAKIFNMYQKYTSISVSSESVRSNYAESFNISLDKVLALGVPRTDLYFDENYMNEAKESFFKRNPFLKGKKIYLYSPTYRGKKFESFKQFSDVVNINESLDDESILIYSLHPFDKKAKLQTNYEYLNFTSKEDNFTLQVVADILITDYSSVIFEFSLLKKPMIFYAFDLKSYISEQRGFYYEYTSFVPGTITQNISSLKNEIHKDDFDLNKINDFSLKFMSACDGFSTNRICESLIED